jgi:chitodextrinase
MENTNQPSDRQSKRTTSTVVFLSMLSLLTVGCEISLKEEMGSEKLASSSSCHSIVDHISDAWCQAVQCSPAYSAFCSISPTEPPPAEPESPPAEPESPPAVTAEGCAAAWDSSAVYNQPDKVLYQGLVYEAAHWTQGDTPSSAVAWGPWRNPQLAPNNCNGQTEIDAPAECSVLADPVNGLVNQSGTQEGSIASYSCEENYELSHTASRRCNAGEWTSHEPSCTPKTSPTVPPNSFPVGWNKIEKDCSNLPWQNSVRWNCTQTLPSSATQSCDFSGVDLTKEMCTVSSGVHAMTWCVNPNPTELLVCGSETCDVPKANNSCTHIAMGMGSIREICPN